jgi:putative membrane protein
LRLSNTVGFNPHQGKQNHDEVWAFDRAYIQHMMKDHETDVRRFRTEAQQGQDPELKRWAANTLPTLEAHLSMARNVGTPRR